MCWSAEKKNRESEKEVTNKKQKKNPRRNKKEQEGTL
jgi:hypothetical protein